MGWNIIADSSCDLYDQDVKGEQSSFSTIPFVITVGDHDFVDHENLQTKELVDAMEICEKASFTSCPSPNDWFSKLEKDGHALMVTISSGLSGSYNSAVTARNMILEQDPDKKVEILDSLSTGPGEILIIRKLNELIEKGHDFDTVVQMTRAYIKTRKTVFALSSFNNLVKNGRMSKIAGFVAGKLGFWGVGIASDIGTILIKGKMRGSQKALRAIIDDIKERGNDIETVVISHCHNHEFAMRLQEEIHKIWEHVEVVVVPTRGLCSFYAERGGIIVSY